MRLGLQRSKSEAQEKRLSGLQERLEQLNGEVSRQVERQCEQAMQRLRAEVSAWCQQLMGERSQVALKAIQQGMAAAQQGLKEVKEVRSTCHYLVFIGLSYDYTKYCRLDIERRFGWA